MLFTLEDLVVREKHRKNIQDMGSKSFLYHTFLACGMLISGSINTLVMKAQNNCKSTGLPDMQGNEYHSFSHPWFQSFLMFFGEFACLFGFLFYRCKKRSQYRKLTEEETLKADNENLDVQTKNPRILQLIVALPAICDVFGTTFAATGLLYVDASVFQMLRGSIIVFTGIFSRFFLKRQLKVTHWGGIGLTVVGLGLVGLSSVLSSQNVKSQSKTLFGVFLIIGSQVISALQMVIEETVLKKRKLQPLHVVGMEGTFGLLFMIFIALPAVYFIPGSQNNNSYDNALDALTMIKNSPTLLALSIIYLSSIACYNVFGLSVTKSLTAVHRTLLDACRTMIVWLVGLLIHYTIDKNFGEAWKGSYGIFQVDGFVLLIIGTAMYNQLFDFSWLCQENKIVVNRITADYADDYKVYNNEDSSLERAALLGCEGTSTSSYSSCDVNDENKIPRQT